MAISCVYLSFGVVFLVTSENVAKTDSNALFFVDKELTSYSHLSLLVSPGGKLVK